MQCLTCHKLLDSNESLRSHLIREHCLTPVEYYETHPNGTKFCSKCRKERPITEFFKDKSNNFGYRAQCVYCMRGIEGHKECPICNRIFQWAGIVAHLKRDHYISPVEAYKVHLKEKYCPHCKQTKPLAKFSELENPQQVYFSWCRDCNVERGVKRAIGDREFSLSMALLTRLAFSDRCFVCGRSHEESMKKNGSPLHVDHLLASAKGGTLAIRNVLLLCHQCNLRKGTKDFSDFLRANCGDKGLYEQEIGRLKEIQSWLTSEYERLLRGMRYKLHVETAKGGP